MKTRFAWWLRLATLFAVLCGGLWAGGSAARAHAPQVRRVALTADAAAVAMAMPGFGILMRSEASEPFAYLCDAAFAQQPADAVPSLAFLADGSLIVGSMNGVRIVAADRCPMQDAAGSLSAAVIVALAAQDSVSAANATAQVVYAATAGDIPAVWRSEDGGRSWQRRSPLAVAELVSALLVSPDDPNVIYLSQDTSLGRSALLVSTDSGASFSSFEQDRALTLLRVPSEGSARFWALARSADNTTNRGFDLLHAEHPEGPWTSVLRVNYFGGFTIDDQGIVWVGDEGGGLYRSDDAGETFANVAPERAVACLASAGKALWACTPGTNVQPALMMQTSASASLTPVVALADVDELAECGARNGKDAGMGTDIASICAAAWVEWRRDVRMENLTPQDSGAAEPDSGADPATDGSCSIRAIHPAAASTALDARGWLGVVLLLCAARLSVRKK